MTYASIEDVRAAMPDTDKTDAEIEASLIFAEALVNARAGRSYTESNEQTVLDVRTDTITLPVEGNITSVHIGDTEIPEESYTKTPWGLRFNYPRNGVWEHPTRPFIYEPIRPWWGSGRGVTVRVVGAFGGVPELIKRATLLLVQDDLGSGSSGGSAAADPLPSIPSDVQSFSVEGLSVSRFARAADEPERLTTGNALADRYIDMAVGSSKHGVA